MWVFYAGYMTKEILSEPENDSCYTEPAVQSGTAMTVKEMEPMR